MNFNLLKTLLDNLVEENITPSVDCIVKKEGKTLFRYFAGYRDIENNIKIDGNEEYLIFSMTKLFTCVCALQLFEKGKYGLDDSVEKYLPEFSLMYYKTFGESTSNNVVLKELGLPITVRHLFTMGAGFNYNLNSKNIIDAINGGANDTISIVNSFSKAPLEFEPGTHFNYSLCHDVLGALIEVWSGMKFSEYMNEYILKPLGLNHTYFSKHNNSDNKELASLYVKNNDFEKTPLVNPFTITDNYESGGAGLISKTNDYSVFIDALANEGIAENGYRLLKKETIDLMRTNQLNDQQYLDFQSLREGYGYGLGVRTHVHPEISKSLSPVGEFGWDGAAGSFSMIDPVNRVSLTYFQHCFSWDKATQHELRNKLYESLGE